MPETNIPGRTIDEGDDEIEGNTNPDYYKTR